jgi:hypothetical protein
MTCIKDRHHAERNPVVHLCLIKELNIMCRHRQIDKSRLLDKPASAAFSGRFGSRPVERPFYKFDGIDCRAELDAKTVNRLMHRHWQVPPPVNNAAHRLLDGCYHLLDRHFAVSLRHALCLSLQGCCRSIKFASTVHTTRCIGAMWSQPRPLPIARLVRQVDDLVAFVPRFTFNKS